MNFCYIHHQLRMMKLSFYVFRLKIAIALALKVNFSRFVTNYPNTMVNYKHESGSIFVTKIIKVIKKMKILN